MSCNLPEELLALHAGGDLTVAEASQVETHIAKCAPCAAELEAFRAARLALQEIREEAQPEVSLWAELDARLDAVDAAGRHRLPWFRRFNFAPVMMSAAALLLAVVFYPEGKDNIGTGDEPVISTTPVLDNDLEEPGLRRASYDEMLHLLRFCPHKMDQGVPAAHDENDDAAESKSAVNVETLPPQGNKEKF